MCLASFTYKVCKAHPHCIMYQNFISFYGWIKFQGVDILYFVYPLISWCHLGHLHFLAIMNNAVMSICAQIFVWTYVFKCWVYTRSGISRSFGNSMFNILRNFQIMFQGSNNIFCSLQQYLKVSISLHLHQHLLMSIFFLFFTITILVSVKWCHCGLGFHFLNNYLESSHMLVGHMSISFREMSIQILCSF